MVIRQVSPDTSQLNSAHARRDNLPVHLTSFVGREHEIAEVKRLLKTTRLVTLTGSGGCGKTRLALRVVQDLVESYNDGVWFVELAPLADAALVSQAVATSLGVREQSGQSLMQSLADQLRPRNMLLVLDNCEHVISASAHLADALLRACPDLSILATSREALAIAGETAWIVPSLSLPDMHQPRPGFADLSKFEAVQLFVARAVTVQPGFKLTELNAAAVAQVCRQLDGIPLAIELAAARVKVLKTAEIAARLDDRFNLLTAGSRTALPRHQTLRAAIDWSYDLLTEQERVLLRRISVFAGGFSLEAAEFVCSDERLVAEERDTEVDARSPFPELRRNEILDLVSHLVDKSLVSVDKQRGETRYEILETIRQYAYEKLLEAGELAYAQNRHLEFYLQLAEEAVLQLNGREQGSWLDRLENEHDNFRTALRWSLAAEDKAESRLRLAGALESFWTVRGYFSEGREYLSAALAKSESAEGTTVHANALFRAGILAYMQSDYPAARAYMDASLAIYREPDSASRQPLAATLGLRGYLECEVGEYAEACRLMLQALEIFRELNDEHGIAGALSDLGACYLRAGDYVRASECLEEALPLLQQYEPRRRAIALTGLSEIALRRGNFEDASQLEKESLLLRREVGDKWGIAVSLGNLAWVALKRDDLQKTVALLLESIGLRRELGDQGGIAWCLEKLAEIALIQGQRNPKPSREIEFRRAVRLFGAAAALRTAIGSVIDLVDMPEYERQFAVVREQLGTETFETMWTEGQVLTLEQVIEYALETPAPREVASSPQSRRQSAKQEFGGLTEREREIAALVAQGHSNREIAEGLVLSERTVEVHVTNILNKLGFTNRRQVRKWAIEKDL